MKCLLCKLVGQVPWVGVGSRAIQMSLSPGAVEHGLGAEFPVVGPIQFVEKLVRIRTVTIQVLLMHQISLVL